MIDFDFNKFCYGCSACKNICPKHAISMIEGKNGFFIPKIDKEKCIECGLCEKKCPYINFKTNVELCNQKWLCGYSVDEEERIQSTSGGIFYHIAKKFIEDRGYVCGCVWDENFNPIHIITNNINELKKMRGSKYVQSDMKQCHSIIKKLLSEGKKVLFSGTPCQVASIKLFVGKQINLYTISIICEGVAINRIWNIYKNRLEKKNDSKLENVCFRNKAVAWNKPVAYYRFKNGKEKITLSYGWDKYVIGFLEGLYNRDSCYNCQYKGNGHNSDIIIGDYWGANKEQIAQSKNKGISLIILNTEKGKKLFNDNLDGIVVSSVNRRLAVSKNQYLMNPMKMSEARKKFIKNLDDINIENINKKIKKNTKYNYKKGIIKEIIFKLIK